MLGFLVLLPWPGWAEIRNISVGEVQLEPVATGLDEPWALGFLPDGGFLITLRNGALLRYGADHTTMTRIDGLPEIAAQGQGGLLDILVPRDFAETSEIYFTFARPQGLLGNRAGTALARARLQGDRLEDVTVIWELARGSSGGRHFGSRVVEGPEGFLFVTIGDRGDRPSAQDLSVENGAVLRVDRAGVIPPDNPFVTTPEAAPAIWSFGHRNPQGAAFAADGTFYVVEHGARGGDEVNAVEPGLNYGWPVIAYGRHYTGLPIGVGTQAEGLEQPLYYWDPSIAPSGLAVYSGAMFPEWEGHILVGALAGNLIARLDPEGGPDGGMVEVEQIATPETQRVRDVRVAPDGSIWFLSVGNGTLYRMTRPED